MSEPKTYKSLSGKEMVHILKVQASKLKDAKSESELTRKITGCEVGELRKILRSYVDEDDLDALLNTPIPAARSYVEEVKPKPVRGAYKNKSKLPSTDQLLQQAKFVRANKNEARKRQPELKNMTDAELDEVCNQWEEVAKDPAKREMMEKAQSSMTKEEMESLASAQKAAKDKAASEGKKMSEMDVMLELRKKNPDQFKKFIRKQMPADAGTSDAQLETMLKAMDNMSDEQLKTTMAMTTNFQGYFKVIDEYTGGNGKIVLGVAVAIILILLLYVIYLIVTFLWSYVMGTGGSTKHDASYAPTDGGMGDVANEFGDTAGTTTNSEYDEF